MIPFISVIFQNFEESLMWQEQTDPAKAAMDSMMVIPSGIDDMTHIKIPIIGLFVYLQRIMDAIQYIRIIGVLSLCFFQKIRKQDKGSDPVEGAGKKMSRHLRDCIQSIKFESVQDGIKLQNFKRQVEENPNVIIKSVKRQYRIHYSSTL